MSEPTEKPLLPCPFCGKPPRSFVIANTRVARCEPCGLAKDVATWNTRAPSAELAAVEAQAAAMREALLMIQSRSNQSGCVTSELWAIAVKALESNAGAELLDRLSKAEALAIQMTAEREHNALEALAMRAERDRLRQERDEAREQQRLAWERQAEKDRATDTTPIVKSLPRSSPHPNHFPPQPPKNQTNSK